MEILGSENVMQNLNDYIKNCPNLQTWVDNGLVYTVGDNKKETITSYTISLLTHYKQYPYDELKIYLTNASYKIITYVYYLTLLFPKLNKVIFVNNMALSTNLYSKTFWENNIEKIKHHPSYPTAIRSIMDTKIFEQNGFVRILSRYVNIMNPNSLQKKHKKRLRMDINRMRELLQIGYALESYNSQPTLPYIQKGLNEISEKMLERFKFCYDSLYVKKYSQLNPQFTTKWLRLFMSYEGTSLIWIRDPSNIICAIVGYYKVDNFTTATLFGYDTDAVIPNKINFTLYSALSTLIYLENVRLNTIGHYSGGCRDYKKQRGATAHLEYTMVYYKHLSYYEQVSWIYMHILTRIIEFIYYLFIKNI